MAVSQKQIAEKLGVSIALVSRVLSGRAEEIGISPATSARVLRASKEMGYVPSAAALSLKGKPTKTIGVTVYDFNDPFFGALIKQIQTQAHEHNYSLVLAGFLNRTPNEQDLQSLYKHALDGLIVIGTDLEATWLHHFKNLPVARIGHGNPEEQSVRVTVNEDEAALLLIDHIIERGRKRPMYISSTLPAHGIRRTALKHAAKRRGLELPTEESSEQDAFTVGMKIATHLKSEVDTLICATDQIAMGALHALHIRGIAVPEQIAVSGFDDIAVAEQFIPAITTIQQPIEQIVEEAFTAVIHSSPPKESPLPCKLVIRQTT